MKTFLSSELVLCPYLSASFETRKYKKKKQVPVDLYVSHDLRL